MELSKLSPEAQPVAIRGVSTSKEDPTIDIFISIFVVGFFCILALWIFVLVAGIAQAVNNSTSPVLKPRATIIDKRESTSGEYNEHTSYYVTFDIDDVGERQFSVPAVMYKAAVIGSTGTLEHRGTQFIAFTV